ncbi:MAG: hypothetical protein WD688_12380 [Candidatus Binatia bacterium]
MKAKNGNVAKRVMVVISGNISPEHWRNLEVQARECKMTPWDFFADTFNSYLSSCAHQDLTDVELGILEVKDTIKTV